MARAGTWTPTPFSCAPQAVEKPPFLKLEAGVLRPPVVSILRVRPKLSHLLRLPSLKGPLRPALAYEGVPPLPHTHVPQAKMEGAQTQLLWDLPCFSLFGLNFPAPRAPIPWGRAELKHLPFPRPTLPVPCLSWAYFPPSVPPQPS